METPEKSFLLGMEEQILLLASGIGGGGGHSSGLGDLKEQQPLPPPTSSLHSSRYQRAPRVTNCYRVDFVPQ